MAKLSGLQRFVALHYENGEFGRCTTEGETKKIGDTLFRFLILEAGDAGNDKNDYLKMLNTAQMELDDLAVKVRKDFSSWYENHYRHCGQHWTDEWDCGCDSECPKCGADISPYKSVDIAYVGEQVAKALK